MQYPNHYNAIIQRYMREDKRIGVLPQIEGKGVVTELQHPSSMNRYNLSLVVEKNCITMAKYKVYACGVSIACLAWVTEYIEGKTIEEAQRLTAEQIVRALQIPLHKQHCAGVIHQLLNSAWEKISQRGKTS